MRSYWTKGEASPLQAHYADWATTDELTDRPTHAVCGVRIRQGFGTLPATARLCAACTAVVVKSE